MTPPDSSATKKLVFPHIMKTGGTALIAWIQRHYFTHEILLAATTWPELLSLPRGSVAGKKFVRGHFGSAIMSVFGQDKGFTPIALLRDPVERVVSHFWHLKFAPEEHPFRFVREASFTIEQFVEHPALQCVVSNYQTANLSATADPEAEAPVEPAGGVGALEEVSPVNLEVAKAFVDSCAVVGVAEELPALISKLGDCFGFFPETTLPKYRSYRPPLPVHEDILPKIRALNEADFELYRYVKDTADAPRRNFSIARRQNPNAIGNGDAIRWVAGMPYWGHGWSDVMADDHNNHIWSLEPTATIEFVVRPGDCHTLLFSIQRFVTPLQKECFSVQCDGKEVAIKPIFVRGGDDLEICAAVLGPAETENLRISFRVSTLIAFRQLSDDPCTLPRGVALSSITLLAYCPHAAGEEHDHERSTADM